MCIRRSFGPFSDDHIKEVDRPNEVTINRGGSTVSSATHTFVRGNSHFGVQQH